MKLYLIFLFDVKSGVEIFIIELESNCDYIFIFYNDGVEEYIIVIEGEIEMDINNRKFVL